MTASVIDALAEYKVPYVAAAATNHVTPAPVVAEWPEPPAAEAFSGLFGRMVEVITPHSEADPVAILGTALIAFGSAIGSRPHALVGADRHGTNLFLALVGKSAKARKGASFSPIRRLMEIAAPDWESNRVISGLGSGEGLVFAVRDRVEKQLKDGTVEITDPGEMDKRALILAPEFASILRVIARQGSTLSSVLRDAWDRGDLRVTTKNSPLRATGAHVSVLAHVTQEELQRELADTETSNGFANRFLWLAVRRAQLLPDPEPLSGPAVVEVARELEATIRGAGARGEIARDDDARAFWRETYSDLSRDRFGMVGALTDRAEAIVLRLALIYALADRCVQVKVPHLTAALALWDYAERSVEYLFGDSIGDPVADAIDRALRNRRQLDRMAIRALFAGHVTAPRIEQALDVLHSAGRVRRLPGVATGGRPTEMWESAS